VNTPIRLRLGGLACVAAGMDAHQGAIDHLDRIYVRTDNRGVAHYKVVTEIDRKHALGALYYLESCPTAWAPDQDKTEVSAVRRTVRAWRKALGIKDGEAIPVPPEAG
jgi:hypothetical protein